jgi:hypothetical protein
MDIYGGWETLDTAALLARRDEATATGSIGPYVVPLGTAPLTREVPVGDPYYDYPPCYGNQFCSLPGEGDQAPYWGPQMKGEDPLARRMY